MTHFDIQKASLLDLLFAQRNKQYGAYVLRKYYANRLSMALGLTLTAAFSIFFIAGRLGGTDPMAALSTELKTTDVEIRKFDTMPEEQPKKQEHRTVQRQVQTEHLTNRVQIVKDDQKTDMARIDALDKAAIGTRQIAGDIPTDTHVELPVGPKVVEGPSASPAPAVAEHPFVEHPSEAPYFPGGPDAWRAYLAKMINTPSDLAPGEKRTVLVRFLVAEDGSVTGFQVLQSAGASYDSEVLRVLRRMPKWKPARQGGQAVSTAFQQPVTFQGAED